MDLGDGVSGSFAVFAVSVDLQLVSCHDEIRKSFFQVFCDLMDRAYRKRELFVAGKAHSVVSVGAKCQLIYCIIFGGKNALCHDPCFFKGKESSVNRGKCVFFPGKTNYQLVKDLRCGKRNVGSMEDLEDVDSLLGLLKALGPEFINNIIVMF